MPSHIVDESLSRAAPKATKNPCNDGQSIMERTRYASFGECSIFLNRTPLQTHEDSLISEGLVPKGFNETEAKTILDWQNHAIWKLGRNRSQVTASFPMLAHILAKSASLSDFIYMDIGVIVDRGDPLSEGLARICNVQQKSVRLFRGKTPGLVGRYWLNNPIELLVAINKTPEGCIPSDQQGWHFFTLVADALKKCFPYWLSASPSRQGYAFANWAFTGLCKAGLEKSWKKLDQLWNGNFLKLADAEDYLSFMDYWSNQRSGLTQYGIRRNLDNIVPVLSLLQRYSILEIFRQSEIWHQEIAMVGHDSTSSNLGPTWPGLIERPMQFEHLTVVPLTSPRELEEEGARLLHCVGIYSSQCMFGDAHILSIRTPYGSSLSTIEIALIVDQQKRIVPTVVQHRSLEDEAPSPECQAVLELLLAYLQTPELQDYLIRVQTFHEERRREAGFLMHSLEFPYTVETMDTIMRKVLPNYETASEWLAQQRRNY